MVVCVGPPVPARKCRGVAGGNYISQEPSVKGGGAVPGGGAPTLGGDCGASFINAGTVLALV